MNSKINRVAEVLDLKLEDGKINLTAKLKGEAEQIKISVDYVVQNEAICISEVETNREWLCGLWDIFKGKYSKINLSDISKNEFAVKIIKSLL